MKIVYFATYYTPYLEQFYRQNPEVAELSYAKQMERILYDSFGHWGSYTISARLAGEDAHLIIANCKPLQKKWCQENKIEFIEKDYQYSIPIEQVKLIKPDVFFIGSMFEYYGDFITNVRKYCKNIFGWISCPIPNGLDLKQIDLLLTSLPSYVNKFKSLGIESELLPACFDSSVLPRLEKLKQNVIDVSFVGGFSYSHTQRIELLTSLSKTTPIQIYGYGIENIDKRSTLIKKIVKHPIKKKHKGEAWGLGMFNILRNSKITLNSHIDIAGDYGVNMRMYEATGVGTLLISDRKKNELFIEDKEIVLYSDIIELTEKINYYLTHDEKRKSIAKAGQDKTLKEYNIDKNIAQMIHYFKKHIK
jgi:spore maturation protein CgeB